MRTAWLRPLLLASACLLPLGALGCDGSDDPSSDESDLTSVRGRSRELKFEGVVHVPRGSDDAAILRVVHQQTKTAFGPLKELEIGVNDRELKGVDPATFVKRDVDVVDTQAAAPGASTPMMEVRYTYQDDAVVPKSFDGESTLKMALLGADHRSFSQQILKDCTSNDSHARDFASDLWYVFEPDRASCKRVIQAEQEAIEAARAKLTQVTTQVAKLEANRLYLPVTVALGADETNDEDSYPEYDRLFTGGVQKGKLVISLINGTIDHERPASGIQDDSGYGEWMDSLEEIFTSRPGFQLVSVEDDVDLSTYTLSTGKTVEGLGFSDFIAFQNGSGFPEGLTFEEERELQRAVAERLFDHWVTFEVKGRVKIGTKRTKDVAVRLMTYFGEANTTTPFKHAIKNSDVFLYNGHSMIGVGPLDPKNFTASDFPPSYQILFIDSCISYNYYEADYIPLKQGGTKNLDLVTNALESPAWRSGFALGQFISTMIDGQNATWRELLDSAEATGSGMRVVDGELDNVFDGAKTTIKLTL